MWNPKVLCSVVVTAGACAVWSLLSAQSPPLDACTVLTRDEIRTLSGNHDPGAPEPGVNEHADVVTNCYWQRTSPKSSVTLWSNVNPNEPKGLALKQMLDRGKKARGIPALGDDAFFVEQPGDTPSGTLYVRVSHYRLVIFREADTPLAQPESVLPTLTAFAKAATPRLRLKEAR